jgi:cobalt-zinc-cadmium efflux system outer membrane protein
MFDVPFARLTVAALALHSASASAEPIELDIRGALDRAHRAAPDAVAARGRITEAEAGVIAADVPFTANPEIEGGAGPRFTTERPIDAEVRIEQDLEPWRRGPRRELARVEVGRARGDADLRLRELDLEVSLAFYESLYADREVELAKRAADFALRGANAADLRRKAGDITDLDANLAKAALGRAHSAVEAASYDRSLAAGKLAALIGAAPDDTIVLRGDLKPVTAIAASPSASNRADVRALDLERAAAVAEHAQATAHGRPGIAIWLGYQREDTAGIVLAGLRMSLPVWNRAQGEKALASAKERRARETRDATLRMANREIADALTAYAAAERSVELFEREVVPALDDSERLLEKTLDAGQIAVSEYLFARQEILNGRREHLQRLLALAKASIAVRYVAGVAP